MRSLAVERFGSSSSIGLLMSQRLDAFSSRPGLLDSALRLAAGLMDGPFHLAQTGKTEPENVFRQDGFIDALPRGGRMSLIPWVQPSLAFMHE
ncbi:MAG: hypothetical protein PHR35_01050 [Kiritimatiellae bacterium]|nr:hypothetical protein [Kiritimatiellia bacterium]